MDKASFGKKKASVYCGIEMDTNLGAKGGNGTVQGASYFECEAGRAVFSSKKRVQLITPVYEEAAADVSPVETAKAKAPPTAASGPDDPVEWQAALDPDSGDVYVLHHASNRSQ